MKKENNLINLLYVKKHHSCLNYTSSSHLGFKYNELDKDALVLEKVMEDNAFIFLLEGKMLISCNFYGEGILIENHILLLAKSSIVKGTALSKVRFISLSFNIPKTGCNRMMLESLSKYGIFHLIIIFPLKVCRPMQLFLELLEYSLRQQSTCFHFHELMEHELYLLLKYNYKMEEIVRFFYPLIGSNTDFKDFILGNFRKVNNVNELIALSKMSKSSFTTKFKSVFGITAKQWMVKQINSQIEYLLSQPGATIKEVMFELNFTSPSHFNRYCMQQFGCTPKQLLLNLSVDKQNNNKK